MSHQSSSQPEHDVNSRVTIDEVAYLARLEAECGIFERLLHVSAAEEPEVAPVGSRAALTALLSDTREVLERLDLSFDLCTNVRSKLEYLPWMPAMASALDRVIFLLR